MQGSTARFSMLHDGRLDRLGIALSGLCAVHCVMSVILMTLVASVGGALLHPAIHEVGLVLAIILGAAALGMGIIRHGYMLPAAIGGLGLGVMAGAASIPHGDMETVWTLTGVALLALGHDLNRRAAA
ncbi:MerC domain-containing protein [Sphingomonas sp. CFBP 13720]|uniref:MerC domain-containing protein n=1 Tax=Sphingomonas sp. CFBP 13720 TaxID=2775302 RepID=UPI0020171949|nr:MerC domain-containing protein [Sphingomonas sp. CFBP 13720]